MRLWASTDCTALSAPDSGLTAIVRYDTAPIADPTTTGYDVSLDTACKDEVGLVPVVERDVQPFAYGNEGVITPTRDSNGILFWDINGSSFLIDWDDPTLLLIDNQQPFPTSYNALELNGTKATWVYFVVQSSGLFAANHPVPSLSLVLT